MKTKLTSYISFLLLFSLSTSVISHPGHNASTHFHNGIEYILLAIGVAAILYRIFKRHH